MNWTAVGLIASREVRERTRSRVFRLGTALTVLIVIAAIVFPVIARANQGRPTFAVGIVGSAPQQLVTAIVDTGPTVGGSVTTLTYATRKDGEQAVRQEVIDVLVVPNEALITKTRVDTNVFNGESQLIAALNDVTRLYSGLAAVGVEAATTSRALDRPGLQLIGLEPAPPRNSSAANSAGSGMILLFVFLTLYGAFILNGVIEEKTSRVVEILLSTVRPNELLIGKVLGIGLVGTIQGAVLVAATFLARSSVPGASSESLTPAVIGYTMLWFVLGFGMYAWLYACAGALVSRSEDAQNLVFPLQIPLVASYAVGLLASINGPNSVLNVMSMIPFTAPMTMLERMAAQQVPLWQVAVSVGLCLVTIYLTMRLAITIFAGGILRSGQRVSIIDAWRNPSG